MSAEKGTTANPVAAADLPMRLRAGQTYWMAVEVPPAIGSAVSAAAYSIARGLAKLNPPKDAP